jgi:hypothetical protein
MTSKHPITCIAISTAIALKLFAGTANAAGMAQQSGRPIMVTDLSSQSSQMHTGRGVDIARVDGQIVLGL